MVFDPHEHCQACGLITVVGRGCCAFCQLDARRAILRAAGYLEAAEDFRVSANPDLVARVLAWQARITAKSGENVTARDLGETA